MSGARSWLWLVPLALLVTAALAAIVTWSQAGGIESSLKSRSRAALASAGLADGEVSFDGRNATLRAFSADKAELAADTVRQVDGVDGVAVATEDTLAVTVPKGPGVSSQGPAPTSTSPSDVPRGKPGLQADIDKLLVTQPMTVVPDSENLTKDGEAAVRRLADLILRSNVDVRIEVDGHVAQGPGGEAAALKLSEDRAKTVARLLISNGIPADRVTSKGFGDTRPNTGGGQDRRVEIKVR
jgi:outer membrane protein OmpA-like peptidoglycan-associated protein